MKNLKDLILLLELKKFNIIKMILLRYIYYNIYLYINNKLNKFLIFLNYIIK
jgi:hypothetical protein